MSNKPIPYSLEAEESLLGNIMLYKDAMREAIEGQIDAKDFYLAKHQTIYSLMSNMYERKENIDAVSLSTKLKDFGLYDKVGGIEYLLQLANATISATNTKEYINIIKNKSLARRIIKVGEEIANDALDASVETDVMLESVEKKVTDVTRSKVNAEFISGDVLFDDTLKYVQKIQEAGSDITGIKSLYSDLDRKTAGFQKGDLIILAARPSMGKTAFALNIALNSASVTHGSIAIFSLEMPAQQVAIRILAAKAKVEIQKIRTGNLNDEEWSRLNEASLELRRQNFYIDDTPGIKVSEMFAKCRKLAQDNGLYMIIVDYIQLIQGASNNFESRQQEVSDISRKLKAMARELKVPLIALSQLSRSVESRQDKKPMLSDLRESGAIEQDADLVMFLYREAYYNKDNNDEEREDVELILAKHRNGPIGSINLAFEKKINAFYGIKNNLEEHN